jgi:hypothetical protein
MTARPTDAHAPRDLLQTWLDARLDDTARAWLASRIEEVRTAQGDARLNLAIGLAPRKLGKADLALAADELAAADAARAGWWPGDWSIDQAARLLLLLHAPGDDARFAERLEQLCITSDVGESVTWYRGLPLYPAPERHRARAAEGVRSNIKAVFQAVAHHNPYARGQLDEGAWNQMVLKALFVGAALDPIVGLDERANPALRQMLVDYAHERWAASRSISPELWRCVGPVADAGAIDDLARVLTEGTPTEQAAAALALTACPEPRAAELVSARADLVGGIERGDISWAAVAAGTIEGGA